VQNTMVTDTLRVRRSIRELQADYDRGNTEETEKEHHNQSKNSKSPWKISSERGRSFKNSIPAISDHCLRSVDTTENLLNTVQQSMRFRRQIPIRTGAVTAIMETFCSRLGIASTCSRWSKLYRML